MYCPPHINAMFFYLQMRKKLYFCKPKLEVTTTTIRQVDEFSLSRWRAKKVAPFVSKRPFFATYFLRPGKK